MSKSYTIDVGSRYDELWRYNMVIMCGAYDESGELLEMKSEQSIIASVQDALTEAPEGSAAGRGLQLTTTACHAIKAYIYLMPHKLPSATQPEQSEPFALRVRVFTSEDATIYNLEHKVNQWAGATIELKLSDE